jgi:hypothetical protein
MRLWWNSLLRTFGVSLIWLTSFLVVGWAQGFGLFQLWTVNQNIKLGSTYVKASSVDDAAMGTVLAQVWFGNDEYKADPTFENLFRILEVSEGLISVDVLQLVANAENRQQVFQSHLSAIQAIRFETVDVAVWYQNMANRFLDESNACLVRKQEGDIEFYQWVRDANKVFATRWYEKSLEDAPCYITNRIKANAMTYLSTRVQAYAWVLRLREQILTSNQEMILTYPEVLQSDLPSRLLATQRQLAQLKAIPFTQVQWTFGWFTTAQTQFLPNYFEVFFPGRRPTYFDPQVTQIPNS